jgi:hypothetical protein
MEKPLQFNLRTLFLVTALVAVWAAIASIAGQNGYEPEFITGSIGLLSTFWFVVSYRKLDKHAGGASGIRLWMMFFYALGLFFGAIIAIFSLIACLTLLIHF